jgi:hypothetical protein
METLRDRTQRHIEHVELDQNTEIPRISDSRGEEKGDMTPGSEADPAASCLYKLKFSQIKVFKIYFILHTFLLPQSVISLTVHNNASRNNLTKYVTIIALQGQLKANIHCIHFDRHSSVSARISTFGLDFTLQS